MTLKCTMCLYEGATSALLPWHIVRYHKNNPDFRVICNLNGCTRSYQRGSSFRMHLYRNHGNDLSQLPDNVRPVDQSDQPLLNQQVQYEPVTQSDLHLRGAKFLLNLREELNVTQTAVNFVLNEVDNLVMSCVDKIHDNLKKAEDPTTQSVPMAEVENIINEAKSVSLFEGVGTNHLLQNFVTANGGLSPEKIPLGKVSFWSKEAQPRIVEKEAFAYVVPVISHLKQLMCHPEFAEYVNNPTEECTDDVIRDFCDGDYFKSHPIFSNYPQSIIIVFYYDDLCTTNPLGSKTHKFSMFYWMAGNIPAHLRASLKAINVYCIVKTSYVKKFGMDKILAKFVDEINQLQKGVTFVVHDQPKIYRGSLLFVSADTPASQALAKFKESVANAFSPCRGCMVSQETLQDYYREMEFELRNAVTHEMHVEAVTDPTVTQETRKYWSKVYGVTGRSIFSSIEGFDVTQCFVQDLMHVVLEGILPFEIQHFLRFVVVDEQLVSLGFINQRIASFNFEHLKKDTPSNIDDPHLYNALRQSSTQTMALGHVLPFVLKEKIEGHADALERLNNIVKLLQILNLSLSFEFTKDDVALLEHLIVSHHKCFRLLYPSVRLTPKFHFLIHLPRQILQFGPLRSEWCMRFEGAHAYFKRLMSIVISYKNPPFTMLRRYCNKRFGQLHSFSGQAPSKFLDLEQTVQRGKIVELGTHPHKEIIKFVASSLTDNDIVMNAKSVVFNGTRFSKSSVLLLSDPVDEFPVFGKIVYIVVYGKQRVWYSNV